ncbi:cuticlin-1-like [Oppia nitens]|uniref:cuticlin-1-like n=1 Tax=Oppia nitens TaxID=1686743 RepID=UPI0023DC4A4B|nr:cuticlin-1-like [Oppia nitens]
MEPFIYVNSFLLLILVTCNTVKSDGGLVNDVHIECNSNDILVTLSAPNSFNGMIYPKGLSKNSSCMTEYKSTSNITYKLPLRSCNTMSTDVDDGVEYFNTVVVQPHRRLVTNQGRGYHIRCRYQTREKRISNGFNVSMIGTTPVMATAPMPSCSMKIFVSDSNNEIVAENVKIGDKLTLAISIDFQDIYGMKVTNCLVRDGLNWGEQPLINDEGCPVDEEIMAAFEYTQNLTQAAVEFHAHKFPYTSSVYYQCNVRLCLKEAGGCDDVPSDCDKNGRNFRRRERRDTSDYIEDGSLADVRRDDVRDLSIEVYSGLYVNENENEENELDESEAQKSIIDEEFCISMRKFAIGVAIASLLLMLAVILLVACILQRRRRRKGASTAGSSIYSGPYSNRAYSRD